ncbi:ABC transporter substrate-binding protein [Pseudomonas brassicacearum]|jgi:Periplasmic binding protein|uniref:ABC transporter n=1 Tax=Pseudomonas brassicacearum TaxID=930166 RepID=A0A423GZV5_9PSED|nr:ABC transporter substrate-binding protein [Pseudomonas brassicacearum]RON03896.1 ABC transporter [Pseudomonas brassicacearum]
MKVAVSALFDPADTPHARTFMRALALARNTLPGLARVQWRFLDDGAHPVRAAEVARELIAWQANIVIGHFSSDAAMAAAPLYQAAGILLLTPAATLDSLTVEHPNVLRGCPSDRQLAVDLVRWLDARGWHRLYLDADPSAHGQALRSVITQTARQAGLQPVEDPEQAQVEVFSGRLRSSREYWRKRRDSGIQRPIMLTDDAASVHLGCADEDDRNTYVIGFDAATELTTGCAVLLEHKAWFGTGPQTYGLESLKLLYVLDALIAVPEHPGGWIKRLTPFTFQSPWGEVRFKDGECLGAHHRIWQLGPTGLGPPGD